MGIRREIDNGKSITEKQTRAEKDEPPVQPSVAEPPRADYPACRCRCDELLGARGYPCPNICIGCLEDDVCSMATSHGMHMCANCAIINNSFR